MTSASHRRWNDVFGRSVASSAVFTVKDEGYSAVWRLIHELGLVEEMTSGMRMPVTRAWALLDGFVTSVHGFGMRSGTDLASGMWVVGFRPFRLLVHLLDLQAPRRLKGEPQVESTAVLLAELKEQREQGADALRARAKLARGISTRVGLQLLVRRTYGDELLPEPDAHLKAVLPATGEWKATGLDVLTSERLAARGLKPAAAAEWLRLGANRGDLFGLLGSDPSEVEPWVKAGIPVGAAARNIESGLSLGVVLEYVNVGVHPYHVDRLLEAGVTPEYARVQIEKGLSSFEILRLVRADS